MNKLINFVAKHEGTIGLLIFGTVCAYVGSRIQAYRSRKGIIKVMDYYENECDKIEDPIKREEERNKVNQMLSWSIRKCLWGPDSD